MQYQQTIDPVLSITKATSTFTLNDTELLTYLFSTSISNSGSSNKNAGGYRFLSSVKLFRSLIGGIGGTLTFSFSVDTYARAKHSLKASGNNLFEAARMNKGKSFQFCTEDFATIAFLPLSIRTHKIPFSCANLMASKDPLVIKGNPLAPSVISTCFDCDPGPFNNKDVAKLRASGNPH